MTYIFIQVPFNNNNKFVTSFSRSFIALFLSSSSPFIVLVLVSRLAADLAVFCSSCSRFFA